LDTWIRANSFDASLRRAKDGKLYITRDERCVNMETTVTTTTAKAMIALSNINYGLTPIRTNVTYHAGAVIGGNMPLQPHRVRVVPCTNNPYGSKRIVGKRIYEFTDHLSNIRAVIGDTRIANVTANSISGQNADVYSHTDYYAFGMVFREQVTSNYRYGFNGQEKDNEILGNGNSYTAEYWQYDSRLGRRWNLDPKPFKGISDYACFINNPVLFNDPDGDVVDFTHLMANDRDAAMQILTDLKALTGLDLHIDHTTGLLVYSTDKKGNPVAYSGKSPKGGSRTARRILLKSINSGQIINIKSDRGAGGTWTDPGTNDIYIDGLAEGQDATKMSRDINVKKTFAFGITFFHEWRHTIFGGDGDDPEDPAIEPSAQHKKGPQVRLENRIRRQAERHSVNPNMRMGRRMSYYSYQASDGHMYMPFSRKAKRQLRRGEVPTKGYYKTN
jgi:RHS repeat-associated protein